MLQYGLIDKQDLRVAPVYVVTYLERAYPL